MTTAVPSIPTPTPVPPPAITIGTPDTGPDLPGIEVVSPTLARDDDDIDLRDLRQALAERDGTPLAPVDSAAAALAPVDTPAPAAVATPEPAPAPVAPKAVRTPMLPKPRVDEMLRAAKAEGRAEALSEVIKTGVTPAAPAVATPALNVDPNKPIPAMSGISPDVAQARLDRIDAEKLALAEKFDAGEIGMKEFKTAEVALDQEARQHQQRINLSLIPQPTAPDVSNDLVLDTETAKLETAHPYVNAIPAEDTAAWQLIEDRAHQSLKAQGVTLPTTKAGDYTPRGLLLLRTEMAKQTDIHGPSLTGKTRDQLTGKTAPAPVAVPPAPTAAQAATRAALARAAAHPIDLGTIGHAAGPTLAPTEADINAMTQEQIEALPAAQRRAFVNLPP